jgi:alpha-mannosidase
LSCGPPRYNSYNFHNYYTRVWSEVKTDAEQSNQLILRLFNIGEEKAPVTITVDGLREASQTNMNEEQIDDLTIKDGRIEPDMAAKQIVTLAMGV